MNTALAVLNAVFILFFLYPDLLNPKKRKLRSQYLVSRWNYSKALGVKSENAIRAVSDTRYLPSLLKKETRRKDVRGETSHSNKKKDTETRHVSSVFFFYLRLILCFILVVCKLPLSYLRIPIGSSPHLKYKIIHFDSRLHRFTVTEYLICGARPRRTPPWRGGRVSARRNASRTGNCCYSCRRCIYECSIDKRDNRRASSSANRSLAIVSVFPRSTNYYCRAVPAGAAIEPVS